MLRHLGPLLYWQMRFDHRRVWTWLVGAAYLLIVGPILLRFLMMIRWVPGAPLNGKTLFIGLTAFHWFLSPIFAAIRGCRTTDDRVFGALALLKIADMPSGRWVAFRLLSVIVGFLPVWCLRLPFYVLAYHMGGLRIETILTAELLQWTCFLTVASASLFIARFFDTPQTARFIVFGLCLFFELMMMLPVRFLNGLALWLGPNPFPGYDAVELALMKLSRLSMLSQLWSPPVDADNWPLTLVAIAVHLAVASGALLLLRRAVFVGVGVDDAVGSRATEREKNFTRPSRRCWDDALAWQAFQVHAGGSRTILAKIIAYGLFAVFLVGVVSSQEWLIALLVIAGMLSLAAANYKAQDCVTREIKGGTLSTLALLPYDGLEFYRGWARGARRLAIPDYLAAAFATLILLALFNNGTPVILSVLFAVLLCSPFLFINGLVGFDWAYLHVGCFTVIAMVSIPLASIFLGLEVHAAAGLGLYVVLALTTHFAYRKMIRGCFNRRVETLN